MDGRTDGRTDRSSLYSSMLQHLGACDARVEDGRTEVRGGVTHRDMPTYKGDDGLSDAERIAYAVCNPVLPLLLLLLL